MAATLANGGKNPVTGKQVMVDRQRAEGPRGDGDGRPLRRLGQVVLPRPACRRRAASAAGIIAVSPGKFGIAVVSPPLDEAGNSVTAQKAIADISNALGGNPLASKRALRQQSRARLARGRASRARPESHVDTVGHG